MSERKKIGGSFAAAPLGRMVKGLAALAAFDFLVPDLLIDLGTQRRDGLWMAVLGAVAGQFLLLSVWAVFGPARFWRRWLSALAALGCLYAAFLAGGLVAGIDAVTWQVYTAVFFLLPLVFFCAQLPLWLLRTALGRGLAWEGHAAPAADGAAQFRLRDVLAAMALIGVLLGLARLAVLLDELYDRDGGAADTWLGLAAACAAFAVWCALCALPCVWAALLAASRVTANLAATAFSFLLVLGASGILALATGKDFSQVLAPLLAFHGGMFALLLVGCHAIRGWGYTLRRDGPAAFPPHKTVSA